MRGHQPKGLLLAEVVAARHGRPAAAPCAMAAAAGRAGAPRRRPLLGPPVLAKVVSHVLGRSQALGVPARFLQRGLLARLGPNLVRRRQVPRAHLLRGRPPAQLLELDPPPLVERGPKSGRLAIGGPLAGAVALGAAAGGLLGSSCRAAAAGAGAALPPVVLRDGHAGGGRAGRRGAKVLRRGRRVEVGSGGGGVHGHRRVLLRREERHREGVELLLLPGPLHVLERVTRFHGWQGVVGVWVDSCCRRLALPRDSETKADVRKRSLSVLACSALSSSAHFGIRAGGAKRRKLPPALAASPACDLALPFRLPRDASFLQARSLAPSKGSRATPLETGRGALFLWSVGGCAGGENKRRCFSSPGEHNRNG
mmetsp:Transcript_36120/g.78449  ORF Transcript_36120/g.78449 Transcript_36120/m.78449 type:complete len:368 (-) Transcript_36120:162-1265(-)